MGSHPKNKRVVVTGMGAVTPLGLSMNHTWNGIIEGVSKARPLTRFDSTKFPTTIGYEVEDFQLDPHLLSSGEKFFLNTAAEYGVQAAAEALDEAGLTGSLEADPYRRGVCVGVGMGSVEFEWYDQVFLSENYSDASVKGHIKQFPDQLGSVLARMMTAKGGVTTVHTACASSGQSLGEAFEQIANGDLDVCLTGGADSMLHPYYLAGFSLLGALSKRNDDPATASRPFDKDRNGFVLGEGASMLIFEEYEHAKARGAKILGEVCGYGVTESAYRITDLHPEGRGPIEAMQMAVDASGIGPHKVGYINAHGTSTLLNDRVEALAVSKVFPKDTCHVHVSSTKSVTGHMISAAGALEFAVCLKALEHQVLPPSVNLFEKDPEILAELCPTEPTSKSFDYALSNSVGFGGSNTAIVAGRAPK